MTILRIRTWPDQSLRVVADHVKDFGPDFQKIVDDMSETMYHHNGVGLAATQVGVPLRVFVMDVSTDQTKLEVMVNHQITSRSETLTSSGKEGCLSFPGIWENIPRPDWVGGTALDRYGNHFSFLYEDLAAQCTSHEGEHLDGKVMIDHLSRQKRRFIERVLGKSNKSR